MAREPHVIDMLDAPELGIAPIHAHQVQQQLSQCQQVTRAPQCLDGELHNGSVLEELTRSLHRLEQQQLDLQRSLKDVQLQQQHFQSTLHIAFERLRELEQQHREAQHALGREQSQQIEQLRDTVSRLAASLASTHQMWESQQIILSQSHHQLPSHTVETSPASSSPACATTWPQMDHHSRLIHSPMDHHQRLHSPTLATVAEVCEPEEADVNITDVTEEPEADSSTGAAIHDHEAGSLRHTAATSSSHQSEVDSQGAE